VWQKFQTFWTREDVFILEFLPQQVKRGLCQLLAHPAGIATTVCMNKDNPPRSARQSGGIPNTNFARCFAGRDRMVQGQDIGDLHRLVGLLCADILAKPSQQRTEKVVIRGTFSVEGKTEVMHAQPSVVTVSRTFLTS
jgi:hypothetical protein